MESGAQASLLQSIETKFDQFRKQDLQEKVYVQTNKSFYIAGETLWFKIFDINGATNKPFQFSKVAYVELLDQQKTPVLQTKVSLKGDGSGSVLIPYTIHTGNYILRAYTSWMKNFSSDFYYHQAITIVNTTLGHDFPRRDSMPHYRIRFFPEGGNLVNGIESEVAFKMMNQDGGVNHFRGIVVNENKDTVSRFRPFKFGMGHFSFLPKQGHDYHAVIQMDDGEELKANLPEPYETGMVMRVETEDQNKVKIMLHKQNIPDREAFLIIQSREAIQAAEVLTFNENKAVFEVDCSKLKEGISQITIFNSSGKPVCERLYFKPVKKKLKVNLFTDKLQYKTREKVQLKLKAENEVGKAQTADWAVSVYRMDALQNSQRDNIFNYLWLSSELKGRIERPDYYFKEGDSLHYAVKNLMMTQGWRRFNWDQVLHQAPIIHPYLPEIGGPIISGMVSISQRHDLASDTKVYLAITGKQGSLHVSRSNERGAIYFQMKNFYGPHQIVVRTNTETKDSLGQIKILSPFSEKYSSFKLPGFPITAASANLLQSHNLWMQVEHSYHSEEMNRLVSRGASDMLPFYGKPYKSYLLDNYTRYVTMEEVLREYVEEVAVRKSRKRYHFMVVNALSGVDQPLSDMLFQDDPLVLFDGVPVYDLNKIMAFDPLQIQKIDVVAGRYFYKSLVADGIVSFTTFKGDLDDYKLNSHALVLDYKGLQKKRIFYEPEYNTEENVSSRIPDFRKVLYWSSDINTDEAGKATCSFFTSDLPGKYIVVVNGITADGHAGNAILTFEVK